ncbi:MAG: Ig-like domain-containing protein, partial [Bacteroidota bacterium]
RSFSAQFFVLLLCLNLSFTIDTNAQAIYRINFSDQATPAPQGWLQDYGLPFGNRGNGLSYGWVNPQSGAPVDLTNRGRNRTPNPDKDIFRETFMHMRYGDVQFGSINGDWQMNLPNGSYRISVQVGDTDTEILAGTRHVIRAEGITLIDFSVSPGVFGVRNASGIIQVNDGNLNIDALGSTNAKLHYVNIEPTNGSQTPLITSSSPLDGASNVALNAEIRLNTLSLPNGVALDPTSVNNQNIRLFRITNSGDVSVPITVAPNNSNDEVVINSTADLTAFSDYRLLVDGMTDQSGATFLFFSSIFSTSDELITVGNNIFKINFSDQNTPAPSGWIQDYGLPFGNRGNNLFFGWLDPETKVPISLSTRGRNRNPTPDVDVFRETFMHMRYNDINPTFINGDWAMNIQNGTYRVTVQVGESDPETFEGTRHIIRAENIRLIDYPVAVNRYGVRNASAVVNVFDGQLNIDAFGATNAKLHFVIIEPVN